MARVAVRMFGCSAVQPLLAAPAAGRLRGEHARRSAHASLTDSPWLSERRAPAQSEFHGAPRNRHAAGLPRSKAQGSQTGVALSLVTFFRRRERKLLACRATPGLRTLQRHAAKSTHEPRLRQAQPERAGWRPGFDRHSPAGWGWYSDCGSLSHPPPPSISPPRATPQTAQTQSTHPPPSH